MKLLSTENIGGRIERWYRDADGKVVVETIQDAEPILDANKREYNNAPSDFRKGSFHKMASIPAAVIDKVCNEGLPEAGIDKISFRELVAAKTDKAQRIWKYLLNAREFRSFRTRPGRMDLK